MKVDNPDIGVIKIRRDQQHATRHGRAPNRRRLIGGQPAGHRPVGFGVIAGAEAGRGVR
jgi:hypothetical protein